MASSDFKHLDDKIRALTGIDITKEEVQGYIENWIKDAIREIYSFVPRNEKFRYSIISSGSLASTGITVHEPVLSVIWCANISFNDDDTYEAREMLYNKLFMFNKNSSLFRATDSDPIFYYEPQVSGSTGQKIKGYPGTGYIKVIKFDVPDFDAEGANNANVINSVASIPNEIDHLIVLNASIKALTYLLQSEQDEDIYIPLINTLKADYAQSVQLYISQFRGEAPEIQPAKAESSGSRATSEELQQLIEKYR